MPSILNSITKTKGRSLSELEQQLVGTGVQGSQLSLGVLKNLAQLFEGQSGGIADLIQGSLQRLQSEQASSGTESAQQRAQRLSLEGTNLGLASGLGGQFSNINAGLGQLNQDILRGQTASPQDLAAINTAANSALEAGLGDINRYQTQGLEALRTQLAPSRGLRSSDTPILDRGAQLVSEANRASSQLTNQIRGQQAQLQLQYPLERRASDLAGLQTQNAFATQQQGFLQQLQQQALQNRLLINSGLQGAGFDLGNFGLNLATGGNANTGSSLAALGNAATQGSQTYSPSLLSQVGQFGQLAGGISGLISGIGGLFG